MKKLIVVVVIVLGVFALLSAALVAGILTARKGTVQASSWIELDLSQPPAEYLPDDPLASLIHRRQPRLLDLVATLERAAGDDRIEGLVAWLPGTPLGLGTAQELRQAVERFRAAGKPTVVYADTFGEWTGANGSYYLASAFERIYLQPSGDLGLTGLSFVHPFIQGTLEKLGVVAEMQGRYEYKNALNLFTESAYTPAHREATAAIMRSQFGQLVNAISEGRGISEPEMRALIDRGPFLGEEALEAGLVDGLKYRDEVYAEISDGEPESLITQSPTAYLRAAGRPWERGTDVALVYGVGAVVRGESSIDPLTGGTSMGSATVAGALRDAVGDPSVRAILFRVDSPGGSYVASDTIRREVVRAVAEGKPVVVSMGEVAGSGGYFVAMDANRIVAHPGTITGSIGVLGGKMVLRDMWAKIGVTFDEIHTSENANIWSSTYEFSDSQWERVEAALDRIYDDFTRKAAEGRGLPLAELRRVARGRIWTGADARELRLVDRLGGYHEALAEIRTLLELEDDAPINLRTFPQPKTAFEAVMASFRGEAREIQVELVLSRILEVVQPLARMAQQIGLIEQEPQPLRTPLPAR